MSSSSRGRSGRGHARADTEDTGPKPVGATVLAAKWLSQRVGEKKLGVGALGQDVNTLVHDLGLTLDESDDPLPAIKGATLYAYIDALELKLEPEVKPKADTKERSGSASSEFWESANARAEILIGIIALKAEELAAGGALVAWLGENSVEGSVAKTRRARESKLVAWVRKMMKPALDAAAADEDFLATCSDAMKEYLGVDGDGRVALLSEDEAVREGAGVMQGWFKSDAEGDDAASLPLGPTHVVKKDLADETARTNTLFDKRRTLFQLRLKLAKRKTAAAQAAKDEDAALAAAIEEADVDLELAKLEEDRRQAITKLEVDHKVHAAGGLASDYPHGGAGGAGHGEAGQGDFSTGAVKASGSESTSHLPNIPTGELTERSLDGVRGTTAEAVALLDAFKAKCASLAKRGRLSLSDAIKIMAAKDCTRFLILLAKGDIRLVDKDGRDERTDGLADAMEGLWALVRSGEGISAGSAHDGEDNEGMGKAESKNVETYKRSINVLKAGGEYATFAQTGHDPDNYVARASTSDDWRGRGRPPMAELKLMLKLRLQEIDLAKVMNVATPDKPIGDTSGQTTVFSMSAENTLVTSNTTKAVALGSAGAVVNAVEQFVRMFVTLFGNRLYDDMMRGFYEAYGRIVNVRYARAAASPAEQKAMALALFHEVARQAQQHYLNAASEAEAAAFSWSAAVTSTSTLDTVDTALLSSAVAAVGAGSGAGRRWGTRSGDDVAERPDKFISRLRGSGMCIDFWVKGHCSRDRCRFKHDQAEDGNGGKGGGSGSGKGGGGGSGSDAAGGAGRR